MSGAETTKQESMEEQADKARQEHDTDDDVSGRYWTWSTLYPLLAGTFGPMANAFNICALVQRWREYETPDSSSPITLSDPSWLIAVNALSLAAALGGNAALLLNMASRLRFTIAQPITIGGFYLAGILLIIDMAVLASMQDYGIDYAPAIPNHALTSAFYYAIFAASLNCILASLMCFTVYGANRGYYEKNFNLTPSQRTLMLQTMMFFVYLLVGALIWSSIEGWQYLDAVYWADVTLLTIGLGDFYPETAVGRGLLFPYAIGGILVLGLVVGSIRTLVLERGQEKMATNITEKRRDDAINNVDVHHQTIKIGWFAKAQFIIKPDMIPAQRRGEEFQVMRKVQVLAERERRYMALAASLSAICVLWFAGALIFTAAERAQGLTYLDWLFFSYTSLLTIGYGAPTVQSNPGRAFFVLWTLLAVPSLTILISNMGDTIVKAISDLTDFLGAITVLPGEEGFKTTLKAMAKRLSPALFPTRFTGPGIFGDYPLLKESKFEHTTDWDNHILDRLAERVSHHITPAEMRMQQEHVADHDIHFYHYVLAREMRDVMKDLGASPSKKYTWGDWEYFIKLMGNTTNTDFPDQDIPDMLIPQQLAVHQEDIAQPHLTHVTKDERAELGKTHTWSMPWSWLSSESPLLCKQTESEWIVERLSAALERELNATRRGVKRQPPISYTALRKYIARSEAEQTEADKIQDAAED